MLKIGEEQAQFSFLITIYVQILKLVFTGLPGAVYSSRQDISL